MPGRSASVLLRRAGGKKTRSRSAQKPPSTWDKVVAGPKNLFNKTGEKLGLKKPEKKPVSQYACPRPPVLQKKQPEQKSWFGSWFKPKEPEKKYRQRLAGLHKTDQSVAFR